MKILIVSPFENAATGRGDRNMRLEAELVARGHEVSLVTGDFDHARKTHISGSNLSGRPGLKVLRLPGYRKNVGLARMWCHVVFAVKLWVWAVRRRWDVVVTSSIPPETLLAASALRTRAMVVDVRDIWPDALQAYGHPTRATRLFGKYCDTIFRATLKRADRIMIAAPGFRRWLGRYGGLSPGRVKFVPLGFRREDFRPLSDGGGKYAFCYAGGATPQFDIREFADRFGNETGVVLGSGPLLEAWKQAFPNADFRGPVPRNEAMEIMRQSRLLLFPSNPFAQLPNKAFDCFALGRHVVFGAGCSRATRWLLSLRRRAPKGNDSWLDYRGLETEALAKRAADVVEGSVT